MNPDKSSIAAYTVTIFGDLRDHDDPQDIIDWFKKKCRESKKFGCLIRNATILVENERYGSCSWQDCMDPSFYEDEG
ncbi:MAG: hypothetical protein IJV14_10830 [Lachnospiraceae bacterium]|nr:hypothetical protein [Lachnospiraceae bacterium]